MNKALILEALKESEIVLFQFWKGETASFKPQNRDLKDRPDLCARILDPWGGRVYPTASALVKVRAAIAHIEGEE